MSSLTLEAVNKCYRGIQAVVDLCLQVRPGELVSLLGPSGCGKSTTLQMIAGVTRPDRGVIRLGDQIVNRLPPEQRGIALVLQRGVLFPHLTVGENVAFGLKMRGIARVERQRQALEMLQRVQLQGFAARKPGALSGGQAQRVALARALVIRPQVLLLDEPLSALDANLREEMQELILSLQAETGVTTLVVTHDQAEAMAMSHRIGLMFEGRLHQLGSPAQFYQQPQSEAAARFFGGVNFWSGSAQGHRLELDAGPILSWRHRQQGLVQVTIRPEQIQIAASPQQQLNELPVSVIACRFTGTQWRLTLRTDSGLILQAWLPPLQGFELHQRVWAYLPPEALWCLPQAEETSDHDSPFTPARPTAALAHQRLR